MNTDVNNTLVVNQSIRSRLNARSIIGKDDNSRFTQDYGNKPRSTVCQDGCVAIQRQAKINQLDGQIIRLSFCKRHVEEKNVNLRKLLAVSVALNVFIVGGLYLYVGGCYGLF